LQKLSQLWQGGAPVLVMSKKIFLRRGRSWGLYHYKEWKYEKCLKPSGICCLCLQHAVSRMH